MEKPHRTVFFFAFIAALLGGGAMANLYGHIRSDLEALLPRTSPAVEGVQVLRERMEGVQHLGIVVRAKEPGPPVRFAEALGKRLQLYAEKHSELIRSVRIDVAAEREYVRKRAFLYMPLEDLRSLKNQLIKALKAVVNPQLLLSSQAGTPAFDFSDLEAFWRERDPFGGQFPEDMLVSQDGLTAVVVVFLATADTGIGTIGPFFELVRNEVDALLPSFPGLDIGYAGDVAIAVEELSALESDIGLSAALVCFGVGLSVLLFFGWWLALPAIALPVAIGTAWGFGLSSLFLDSLTSTTAFLGSIIIGNGINPGIMLTARYTEERRRGYHPKQAVKTATESTWRGTLAAAVAAAAGYASLSTTSFRGFSEFAIIGSFGVLSCWIAAYALLPSILMFFDRRGVIYQSTEAQGLFLRSDLWHLPLLRPNAVLCAGGLIVLVALLAITQFDRSHIEYDMSKLRDRNSRIDGEGYWSARMNEVVGRNFTAVALMSDSQEQADILGRELRRRAAAEPLTLITSRVVTSDDLFPPDLDDRLNEIKEIDALLTPNIVAFLPRALQEPLRSLREVAKAPPLTVAELPELLALGLREKDGRFGRTVLLLQSLDGSTWNGALTIAAAEILRDIAAKVTPPAAIAGGFFVSAQVLEALEREALPTTLTAFCAVVAIVLVLFRVGREAFLVLASLLAGVILLAGAVMAFDIRINFLNFMAFPVTFGIGAEYAINVLRRCRQNSEDMGAVMGKTGGAVALCSLTTILGYGSLLLATNQALFSFGLLAVLGEITCLLSAVVLLPAAVKRIQAGGADG